MLRREGWLHAGDSNASLQVSAICFAFATNFLGVCEQVS